MLGEPSGWLTDVDLDHPLSIALAPHFLPSTLTFGRASKPASHWLYVCQGSITSKRERVEVRSTGGQTVFPGSVHESGERVGWCDLAVNPANVSWDVLSAAVDRLRAACAVAECVPGDGARHDWFLLLSGALCHAAWRRDDAEAFVRAVAAATGCDPEHHARGLLDTYQRRADGVSVSGFPKLLEAGVPGKVAALLRRCGTEGEDPDSILWAPGRELAAAEAVADKLGREADLFQRDGQLVEPAGDQLRAMTRAVLRGRIDAACRIVKSSKDGTKPCAPPEPLVAMVHERGAWAGVRRVEACCTYPLLRTDGTVATEPGYDESTGAWLQDCPKISVPLTPTLEDAQDSVTALAEVVAQFPFDGEPGMGLSVWLALVLTLLARPAIRGSVPSFIFDASQSRSGKSLLVKCAGALVTGAVPRVTDAPKGDQDEWGKLLRTVALEAWPLLFLDNVTGRLKSSALEGFVTSGGAVGGRVLGESRSAGSDHCPTIVVVTSNNAELSVDLVGRSITCRLSPMVQDPGLRSGWSHDPLESWVLAERPRLLSAACTILRAHAVMGRPQDSKILGGFETWSRTVASALAWVGLPDPIDSQADLRASGDEETDLLGCALRAWHAQYASRSLTAQDALRDAQPELRAALCELTGEEFLTGTKLGYRLRRVRDRVVDGLFFSLAGKTGGSTVWRVQKRGHGGHGGHVFNPRGQDQSDHK